MTMTRDEVIHWFRRFRYDPEFLEVTPDCPTGSHLVPVSQLAAFIGIPRGYLYKILKKENNLTPYYERKIAIGIEAVRKGLRWKRRHGKWVMLKPPRKRVAYDNDKHRGAA